jgi:hypothetical protein
VGSSMSCAVPVILRIREASPSLVAESRLRPSLKLSLCNRSRRRCKRSSLHRGPGEKELVRRRVCQTPLPGAIGIRDIDLAVAALAGRHEGEAFAVGIPDGEGVETRRIDQSPLRSRLHLSNTGGFSVNMTHVA